jgi:hypothetical protein
MANIIIKTKPDSNKQTVELNIIGDNTDPSKELKHKVKNPNLLKDIYDCMINPTNLHFKEEKIKEMSLEFEESLFGPTSFNLLKEMKLNFNPIQQTGVGTAIILHNYESGVEENILLASQRDAKAPHHPFWFNIPSGGIQGGEQAIIDAARNSGPDGIDTIIHKNMINEFAGEMVMLVPKEDSTYNILIPGIFNKSEYKEQYIDTIAKRTELYQIKYPIMGEIYDLIKNNKFEEVETNFDNKYNPDEITINVKYKDNGKEQTCTLNYPNANFGWTVGKDGILYSCIFFAYDMDIPIDTYYIVDVNYGKEIFPVDLEGLDNGSLWFQRNSAFINITDTSHQCNIIKPPSANQISLETKFQSHCLHYENPLFDENVSRILARYKKDQKDPVKAYLEMRMETEERAMHIASK